ncbi:hypothetical protein O6H91_05G032100 [Diphasiastrum complanatum]|uniref:Uncharacterized protein n=1 Tax=Diphasiastrum complanatum TaxID=34168 RepID=A0ACC2DM85_DIPCM|nr:hypothetical protein O6H91_05G032100 [Diphasiastrum complanatum]
MAMAMNAALFFSPTTTRSRFLYAAMHSQQQQQQYQHQHHLICSSRLPLHLQCSHRREGSLSSVFSSSSVLNLKAHIPQALSTGSTSTLSGISFSASSFLAGDGGSLRALCLPPVMSLERIKGGCPRAASDDIPSYKGFPPMTEKPKWWWRVLACIPYLMPLCETWMYAETAYSLHSFLEDYEFCTYPFLVLLGKLPGWFLLAYFFAAYLGIVRNNRWPHFLRFHVVTGMLLEIIVQVVGTVNDWIPQAIYWGKFGAHYWLAVAIAFLFTVIECIRCALRGMYADVPFLSDASYMQIPYE